MLKDYTIPPLNGGAAKRAVIFLHGLGDSGSGGLLSLGQVWGPHLPDCEFLCPDAPFPFDMGPPDFGGRQWFSLQTFERETMLEGVKNAAPYLNEYIDHVLKTRNLTPDKLAIVGFSQGTMMALYTLPRRTPPVACIVGYSGILSGGETLKAEKKSSPPVLLVHGKMDEVVPFAMMAEAEIVLKQAGISVTTVTCPFIGHSVDDTGVMAGLKFMQQAWKSEAA
ncbi:MAG TPA: alpha/beta fold hydrolase [Alphaproteobacteria bacterium]|nr:alpha/beta fold hydrolase [Alphaproteobacteria bacterium]